MTPDERQAARRLFASKHRYSAECSKAGQAALDALDGLLDLAVDNRIRLDDRQERLDEKDREIERLRMLYDSAEAHAAEFFSEIERLRADADHDFDQKVALAQKKRAEIDRAALEREKP